MSKPVKGVKYEFSDFKNDILEALRKVDLSKSGINESVTLVEGFIYMAILPDVRSEVSLFTGKPVPTILLIGKETSRIYFFSLAYLLPGNSKIKDLG